MEFLVSNFAAIVFYVVAALTIAGAIGVVALKSPVHSALSLLATFFMVAVLFILRYAEFLAAVQVLVYAGGIMVLFLFVIMLVSVRSVRPDSAFLTRWTPLALVGGTLVGLLLALFVLFGVLAAGSGNVAPLRMVEGQVVGNTEAVGITLYTKYLVPFEVVSVVLLVAMIGAIIFGRRDAAFEGTQGEVDR